MVLDPTTLLVIVIAVALVFEFANGWNDSANAIATVISTRVLSPGVAIVMAAGLNFVGAYLGTEVAKTIGGGLVDTRVVTQGMVLASMLSASTWVIGMTMAGMPISGSHSLIGALLGASCAVGGVQAWNLTGISFKVLLPLLISPILGLLAGLGIMIGLLWLLRTRTPTWVNRKFGRLQILSAGVMALSHGHNDAQKVMGVITLALVAAKVQPDMTVPLWVITICAITMGIGTATGGYRVIKTLGVGLTDLKPVHGFAAETGASMVILGASELGIPVSTTHTITASIMGVGAIRGWSAVRWALGRKIVWAWVVTFPATAALGAGFYVAIHFLIP